MSESESYVTTDGQSASLSWNKASICGLRPDYYFRTENGIRLTVTFLIPWGALSDERTGLSFVCAAGPCQRSLSCDRILLSQIWDFAFRRLLRLTGSRWRYSTLPPQGYEYCYICNRGDITLAQTAQKTVSSHIVANEFLSVSLLSNQLRNSYVVILLLRACIPSRGPLPSNTRHNTISCIHPTGCT
jgi:hypothetical protein